MLPGEIIILIAIVESGELGKKLVNSPMDVTSEYIGYLYNSLVKRGFLTRDSSTGYQLTAKGRDALFEFLRENRTRVKDMIGSLQQLCIGISSQEIEEVEKKPIEVK
jgi:predicted transcriptional regulator